MSFGPDLDRDLDTIEDAIVHLHRIVSRHSTWEAMMQQAGISIDRPGAIILHILSGNEAKDNCRVGALAGKLGVEAPSVTRQIQQLESAGLVKRQPDPEDGRAADIAITAAGRKVAKQITKVKRQRLANILKDWPASDRRRLATLFHRLAEQLSQEQSKTN